MRILMAAVFLSLSAMGASAQAQSTVPEKPAGDGGKTIVDTQGQAQPQGPTGPINTGTSGGAPAASPQGETPPGMQSAPEGSSKTIVETGKPK